MSFLRSVDYFPKFKQDVQIKTYSGAIVSSIAMITMIVLFFSELNIFLTVEKTNHLTVDTSRGEKLKINLDITFPHIPCSLLTLDVMDMSGTHADEVDHTITKTRLDTKGGNIGVPMKDDIGNEDQKAPSVKDVAIVSEQKKKMSAPGYCGTCYGAEDKPDQCCNTCESVKMAYNRRGWAFASFKAIEQCQDGEHEPVHITKGEGCKIAGFLELNKVAGNVHFAPGKSFNQGPMHMHDIGELDPLEVNMSHVISHLSFGASFPGAVFPLDNSRCDMNEPGTVYQYYVKIVRTEYKYLNGKQISSNSYSVTEHNAKNGGMDGKGMPGVFFFYDVSPIMASFEEKSRPFFHFITQLLAIVGGVFTISSIIDRILHATVKTFEQKGNQGKLS